MMVLQRLFEGCTINSKIPRDIISFVNNIRGKVMREKLGYTDHDITNAQSDIININLEIDDNVITEIDNWLNDKGLDVFLFEFKQGNMIGAKIYSNLT